MGEGKVFGVAADVFLESGECGLVGGSEVFGGPFCLVGGGAMLWTVGAGDDDVESLEFVGHEKVASHGRDVIGIVDGFMIVSGEGFVAHVGVDPDFGLWNLGANACFGGFDKLDGSVGVEVEMLGAELALLGWVVFDPLVVENHPLAFVFDDGVVVVTAVFFEELATEFEGTGGGFCGVVDEVVPVAGDGEIVEVIALEDVGGFEFVGSVFEIEVGGAGFEGGHVVGEFQDFVLEVEVVAAIGVGEDGGVVAADEGLFGGEFPVGAFGFVGDGDSDAFDFGSFAVVKVIVEVELAVALGDIGCPSAVFAPAGIFV